MILLPAVRELLSVHEIFRRLGFLARDLYVDVFPQGCSRPGCDRVHVQFALRIGEPTSAPLFRIDIYEDCSTVEEEWPKAALWWNSPERTKGELDEIYQNSFAVRNKVSLLMALSAKGLIGSSPAKETV